MDRSIETRQTQDIENAVAPMTPAAQAARSLEEVHETVPVGYPSFWRRLFAFLGPAYMVSVGYMDPGNWATDIEAGSRFSYELIWVLLLSNAMAVLLQTLSARMGIVAGRDLAQGCRELYSRPVSLALWVLCEIAIAACDLAEVIGTVIGLNLLFGLPLAWGIVVTACDTFLLFAIQRLGIRVMEGFLQFRMRPWLRRLVTRGVAIVPALVTILWFGSRGLKDLLILSQVVLSLQLPFAVIPLLHFTGNRDRMGHFANRPWVKMLGWPTTCLAKPSTGFATRWLFRSWPSESLVHNWGAWASTLLGRLFSSKSKLAPVPSAFADVSFRAFKSHKPRLDS